MSKVPIFCSLLPVEFLIKMGFEPFYLTADELATVPRSEYHCAFHENICSYSKALYEYLVKKGDLFDFIVVPSSCDAMKKLYTALAAKMGTDKLHLLDFPKNKDESAVKFYASELERLACHCERQCSPSPNPSPPPKDRLADASGEVDCVHIPFPLMGEGEGGQAPLNTKIAVMGANVYGRPFELTFKKFGFEKVVLNQCMQKAKGDMHFFEKYTFPLFDCQKISAYYIANNKCPRTNDASYRAEMLRTIKEYNIAGVIINVFKFCDFYPFDYMYLRKELGGGFPILTIEHDLMSKDEGQIMTRLEAFFESIKGGGRRTAAKPAAGRASSAAVYFIGIDSGSHATKAVCIDKERKTVAAAITATGTSVKESAKKAYQEVIAKAGIKEEAVAKIIATGYGRNSIGFAGESVTEITCHALGAHHILNEGGTIIDIGGQDSKAIKIDKHGAVLKFAMNDKCAAGTGRFLEVIADRLQMKLEEFARLAIRAKGAVPVSSMCSVFAESEVISLIAEGRTKEEISKGIHRSIAARTAGLVKRVEGSAPYYMTGGVAKNPAMVAELSQSLGGRIAVIENPQTVGALGAAIYALKNYVTQGKIGIG